jgi:hypothetical protein
VDTGGFAGTGGSRRARLGLVAAGRLLWRRASAGGRVRHGWLQGGVLENGCALVRLSHAAYAATV